MLVRWKGSRSTRPRQTLNVRPWVEILESRDVPTTFLPTLPPGLTPPELPPGVTAPVNPGAGGGLVFLPPGSDGTGDTGTPIQPGGTVGDLPGLGSGDGGTVGDLPGLGSGDGGTVGDLPGLGSGDGGTVSNNPPASDGSSSGNPPAENGQTGVVANPGGGLVFNPPGTPGTGDTGTPVQPGGTVGDLPGLGSGDGGTVGDLPGLGSGDGGTIGNLPGNSSGSGVVVVGGNNNGSNGGPVLGNLPRNNRSPAVRSTTPASSLAFNGGIFIGSGFFSPPASTFNLFPHQQEPPRRQPDRPFVDLSLLQAPARPNQLASNSLFLYGGSGYTTPDDTTPWDGGLGNPMEPFERVPGTRPNNRQGTTEADATDGKKTERTQPTTTQEGSNNSNGNTPRRAEQGTNDTESRPMGDEAFEFLDDWWLWLLGIRVGFTFDGESGFVNTGGETGEAAQGGGEAAGEGGGGEVAVAEAA